MRGTVVCARCLFFQLASGGGVCSNHSSRTVHCKVMSDGGAWLDVHHNPVASLYTFSSCMALEDLDKDGDHKLLVADLGTGHCDMKLKVFQGTKLKSEIPLLDLPVGLCSFHMDTTIPQTPAVAVASGNFVYIYKGLRPYFRFTLPTLELNSAEADLWGQMKADKIDAATLREMLESVSNDVSGVPLTVRSQRFLQLDRSELHQVASTCKHVPLKRQSIVTAISTIHKTFADQDSVSCLLVATENRDLYVLDPEAFTILSKMVLPSVPVFICAWGQFDVEYEISIACRDAAIYTLCRSDVTPRHKISLGSQPCGMVRLDKTLVVGSMDNSLSCYLTKGKMLWSVGLPHTVTALDVMDHQARGYKAVMVALGNKEVRIYRDQFLVNVLKLADIVVSLRFGRYGRESGSLLMVTQGGALDIKILRRTVTFERKELNYNEENRRQAKPLDIPKKTKLFFDQSMRDKEAVKAASDAYTRDVSRLRLLSCKAYAKAVSSSLTPMVTKQSSSVKVAVQVQGLGPMFRLTVSIQNTHPSNALVGHYITFKCNELLYRIHKKIMQVPSLVPSITYKLETVVECMDDMGRSEPVYVFVLGRGSPSPLITAVINMPVSETVVVA